MTMIDAMSQVSQIQATISQLSTTRPQATAAASASAAGSANFAEALTAANGIGSGTAATPGLSAATVPGTATGAGIAEDAKKYLGVPYVWGGTDPKTGLDCSGLVQRVYKDMGINLPRIAVDQGNAGTTVPNLAAAKPGDLLVMHNGGHIGIYMGNNKYIHAPQPGMNVQIADIPAGAVFDKITRIIPDTPAITAASPSANTTSMTDLLSSLQASLATGAAA